MATLNIRRRGEASLKMPNVRQVDYSAVGNNAYTQLQASGSQNFSPMIEQLANAGTKWIESLNATDEKEAAKLAQKVALAQDEAKEQILIDMQMNPSDASSWEDRWNKAVDSINQTYGIADMDKNSYRYRQFEEKMQVPTHNARMAMIKSYNNIQIKDIQETAKSSVDFAINNAINADAMVQVSDINTREVYNVVDNAQAVAEVDAAIENYARVNNLSEEAKGLLFQEAKAKLALGVANRAISMASDTKALDTIDRLLRNIGNEAAPEAEKNAIRGAFGDIDPNALTPEKRVAMLDSIRKRRADLVQAQSEYVTGLEAQYLEGKIDTKGLIDERNKMYDKDGKPLVGISSINRLDKLIATAQTKADNEAVEAFMVEVARTDPDDKTLDILVAALPATVRNSLRVANFVEQAKAGNAKAAWDGIQEQRKIDLDRVVYNIGTSLSVSERQAKLEGMRARGEITGDQYGDAMKKVEVETQTRTREIAQTALKTMLGDMWGSDFVLIIDNGGFNASATLTNLNKGVTFTNTAKRTKHETFVKVFDEYYTEWVKLVSENPSWSQKECYDSFMQTMQPVFNAYTENALEFKGEKWQQARDLLDNIRTLNDISVYRKGQDHSVDTIGRQPLKTDFYPVTPPTQSK